MCHGSLVRVCMYDLIWYGMDEWVGDGQQG